MQTRICSLLVFFISTFSFLGADLLPYKPGLCPVEYTEVMTMSTVGGSGSKKELSETQVITKFEMSWVSQDEIHLKIIDLSINLSIKAGKKSLFKWKYNGATKKDSLKADDAIWDICAAELSSLKVGLDYMIKRKMVFVKGATGKYQETTGDLAEFKRWVKDKVIVFKDARKCQTLEQYQYFFDSLFYFANKEIQPGKQQISADETNPFAKEPGVHLSPVRYNFKRGPDNGYFAYTHFKGTSKKKGVKLAIKGRGKIEWNAQNALLQTQKQLATITGKKKGDLVLIKIERLLTSKAL